VNDNYLDGEYHIPYVHPGLNSQLDMKSYHTKLYDRYSVQYANTSVTKAYLKDVKVGEDFKERVVCLIWIVRVTLNFCSG
jgi:hypothetical protein